MRRRSLLSAGAASLASGCLGFGVNDDNTQAEEHTGNQDSENQETDSSDEDEQSKSDEDGQSKVAETGNLIIAETRWLTKFDNTISGLDSLHSQIDSISVDHIGLDGVSVWK